MSYNGSGTFQINTSGQPVIAGTVISSTAFNALTADLATGLSTAITKDGQTATTVRIPFAQGITSTLVTDSSSTSTGSIITAGGVGIAKALFVGTTANVAGAVTLQSTLGVTGVATFSAAPIYSSLTASSAVATDASKGLVSVTNTGTGNNVLATSPTLVTPILGTPQSGTLTNCTGLPTTALTGTITEANGGTGTTTGYYGFKNRIINGAMVISQRNGTSATTVNGNDIYTLDRYKGWASGGGVFTVTQSTTAPTGFNNSALITVTTADASIAAGDNYRFAQVIEGYNIADLGFGTASASTVTLSFWVRSSITGTFGGSLYSVTGTRAYVFNYTINAANTWEQKTVTIAGDTSGTWNTTNSQGITVYFDLGSGSNYENATGSWVAAEKFRTSGNATLISTLSNTWYVTGVQLEKGSTATSFDYRPYGTELLLCQRYYETTAFPDVTFTTSAIRVGVCLVGVTTASSGFNFLVPKRTNSPTVTLYSRNNNSGKVSLVASGADVSGTSTASSLNGTGFSRVDMGAAQTGGAGIEVGWTASAEL